MREREQEYGLDRADRRTGRCASARMAVLLAALLSSCTLVKPVVGVLTGPFLLVRDEGGLSGCNGDGAAYALCMLAGIGLFGGLVTGAISDFQVVTGAVRADVTANWWHPFKTNADR